MKLSFLVLYMLHWNNVHSRSHNILFEEWNQAVPDKNVPSIYHKTVQLRVSWGRLKFHHRHRQQLVFHSDETV